MSSAGGSRHTARGRPGLAAVLLPALSVALALGPARDEWAEGASTTLVVRSEVELAVAVERLRSSGGTIVLRPGRYEHIVLGPRGPGRLIMRALPGAIAGIDHLEVGRDELHDPRSWDLVLIMEFASVEALRAYQQHPQHLALMAFNEPFVANVASVDFSQAAQP